LCCVEFEALGGAYGKAWLGQHPFYILKRMLVLPFDKLEKESTMSKSNFFESKILSKVIDDDFDGIDLEECFERFMARNAEMLVEAEVELIRHKDKCRQLKRYTPEDIKKAMRFYNCLLCSLTSFV
jgi:polyphosphate kinase